jgi:multiple sugar transport system substrate-binding protein
MAAALSACGAGADTSSASGSLDSRGPITYVQAKDGSNVIRPLIAQWNKAHPGQKVTFKEQPASSDQQHDDLVQHFQSRSSDYDVVDVDDVWTAEFAAKGWLQPLKGKAAFDTAGMLPATVKTARYKGTLYAAPQTTGAALLFYRKDLVPNPPRTWDEMMADCKVAKAHHIGCYAGQFAKYEGLTVNVSEAINSAGGAILGPDGRPTLDTPQAKAGLGNLAKAYADGNIPKPAITYQEEEGRQAFEAGKLLFLRNWPYVYALATTDGTSKVKNKMGMAPLPGESGPGASTLGGYNLGMSAYSKHKATALDFMRYMTSAKTERFYLSRGSLPPVLSSVYDDKSLVEKQPYLPVLKTSIEHAVPRPVTPYYPAVTKAIQDNGYAAIKGVKPLDQALSDMSKAIRSAGSG